MPAVNDLLQERRRNRVDEVGGKTAGGLKVDLVLVTRLKVVIRRIRVIKVLPKLRSVYA